MLRENDSASTRQPTTFGQGRTGTLSGVFHEPASCRNPLTPALAFDISRVHWCLVNKKDLVGKIALDARLTRAQASRALDAMVQGIQSSLQRGDRVTISGFGTFGVSKRKARKVRNPRNGCSMEIAEKRVPRFAPGIELKSAIEENPT